MKLLDVFLLTIAPLLWAGNAVVGRLMHETCPPMTLNFLRWVFAALFLLPLTYKQLGWQGPIFKSAKKYAVLGFLGVGSYNSLQYLALKTSSPINTTLVASISPVFILILGALFFNQKIKLTQLLGAMLSISGVMVVLCRGSVELLNQVHFVIGDVYILIATASWGLYSWLLSRYGSQPERETSWSTMLMGQMVFGLMWSGSFTALEWTLEDPHIELGWPLAATLMYLSIGPALIAYRCWGLGISRTSPSVAGFFSNLTPLFAATLSTLTLGEAPKPYHALAFFQIVGGIWISSKTFPPKTSSEAS